MTAKAFASKASRSFSPPLEFDRDYNHKGFISPPLNVMQTMQKAGLSLFTGKFVI
jgi:hypothetical protein